MQSSEICYAQTLKQLQLQLLHAQPGKRNSKLQKWKRFFLPRNPNGNKNRFRSFLGHPCHLGSRSFIFFFLFFFFFAFCFSFSYCQVSLCQGSLCQVSITLVSFKAIISNLMSGEFDRGNCALSDIYIYIYIHTYMQLVSLSFGWLAYVEFGEGGSWICGRKQVQVVDGSTFKVNGAPNWWHYHFFC